MHFSTENLQQPPGFVNGKFIDHCYLLDKAVYSLKQAPHECYETLTRFLKQSKFKQTSVDPTFFCKKSGNHLMIVQSYVDDIIFASKNPNMSVEIRNMIGTNFEMSSMALINFFSLD